MAAPRKYADWYKHYQSWTYSAMWEEFTRLYTVGSLLPADVGERTRALNSLLQTARNDVARAMRNTNGCS